MNKISCSIIRDLLPSYIDNLTSEESNEIIKTHLTNCTECKTILAKLSQSVEVDTKEANREINYLKRIKAKRKKLLFITILCCTLLFCIIGAVGIKVFVIGEPVAYHAIDFDKSDSFVGLGTNFNPETSELTIYGEILSQRKVFSHVKVEEAKGLVNAYNVTIYAAQRYTATSENDRKFEYVIKVPDDNKDWSFYCVGKIPQDTQLVWSNAEHLDKKAEKPLKILTKFLTENKGFSNDKHHLERFGFTEIFSDKCFTFDFHNKENYMDSILTIEYAVSEDGERIYYYDAEKETWVKF